jgi:hypothetical protein
MSGNQISKLLSSQKKNVDVGYDQLSWHQKHKMSIIQLLASECSKAKVNQMNI